MENLIVWNCDKESLIFILNLTSIPETKCYCDRMVKKVVSKLRFLIKALKGYLQLITALNTCIFVWSR